MQGLMLHSGANRIGRQELLAIPTPEGTATHRPVPHHVLVENVIQALAYRKIAVANDEYGITPDGQRLFGFLTLDLEENGIRLALGLRNSHDKSFSLGMVAGFRVFCCDNLAFHGEFQAVARKHSKHLDLVEVVAMGVDRVQRHFQRMTHELDVWRGFSLTDNQAKEVIYNAFIGDQLDAPKHLAPVVHHHYFEPEYPEFEARNAFSLHNAFTSAFKKLEPMPQFRATASLAEFFPVH